MDDIPEVDASLIDNDDIFQPKWWEIIAVAVAGTALYMLELPTVWWAAGVLFMGCWVLHNCVRRLALRDALHTQMLDRRIQILERQVTAMRVGIDELHRREAMRRREKA
jgi:membrane protein implicated in regulation of membrane protease activity